MKILIAGNCFGQFEALKSIVDGLLAKGKHFDLVLCCGKSLASKLAFPKEPMPFRTIVVDSSETAALLMNQKQDTGVKLGSNIEWLGRSGVLEIDGLRIAHISGVDSDILGHEVMSTDPQTKYVGNHFVQSDVTKVLKEAADRPIDILVGG